MKVQVSTLTWEEVLKFIESMSEEDRSKPALISTDGNWLKYSRISFTFTECNNPLIVDQWVIKGTPVGMSLE